MTDKEKTPLEEITEIVDKEKKELEEQINSFNSGDKEKSDENKPDNEKNEDVSGDDKDKSEDSKDKKDSNKKQKSAKNNTPAVCDGISKAYVDEGMMESLPVTTKEKKSSSWPKPPARGDNKVNVASGKDIMEVFWNEMWALYDKVLDFVVDTTLDFVVFALYPEKTASNEEKVEKADVMVAGEKAYSAQMQKIETQKEQALKIYNEISDNLQKKAKGEEANWTILQKEPQWFSDLVEIKKKAVNDPNSPEAQMIGKFEQMPETLEKMAANCEKMTKIAVYLAIMEEAVTPTTKEQEVNKAKEKYKNNPEKLKRKLEQIEKIYKNPKKEQDEMAERILEKSNNYYNTIMANVNEIQIANQDNPQKIQEELKKYMESMGTSIKDAKEIVYEKMYKEGKRGKKIRNEASEKIKTAVTTVNRMQASNDKATSNEDINVQNWSPDKVLSLIKNNYETGR